MEFKNKEAKAIVDALQAAAATFTARRRGGNYKAIILTLAQVYPEDRETIVATFNLGRTRDVIKSGGAKITRGLSKPARRPNILNPPCDGCPGGRRTAAIAGRQTTPAPAPAAITAKYTSPEAVMTAFKENAIAMAAFAQGQNIKLPSNAKKAETIAKYIYEHYQNLKNDSMD